MKKRKSNRTMPSDYMQKIIKVNKKTIKFEIIEFSLPESFLDNTLTFHNRIQ